MNRYIVLLLCYLFLAAFVVYWPDLQSRDVTKLGGVVLALVVGTVVLRETITLAVAAGIREARKDENAAAKAGK
jgi:hypothetical protein